MIPIRTALVTAALVVAAALVAVVVAPAPSARADDKASAIPADTEIKTTESGLQYSVLVAGKPGKHPKMGESVTVHYTGWLTDGTKFDSSRDRGSPAAFVVGQVIPGWNEALQLMTAGARWKLTIPPKIGYGERGNPPSIGPNATLVFDVELIDFKSLPDFCAPDPAAQKKTESGLKYEVVAEGKGDPPAATDAVELKFAFWDTKGTLIDCTERTGQTVKSRGEDFALAFMKEALPLLRPGARLRFEVPAALCFGDKKAVPTLPPNSTTIWEIELVRVIKPLPVPPFVMPEESKLTTTKSGLKYEVIEPGEGASPRMGEHVHVHYAGWLADGTLFDASYLRGEDLDVQLGRVIPGWNEGLQMMKPGSVYRFVIPPALGYGDRQAGAKIPPNSTLVFHVKLIRLGE